MKSYNKMHRASHLPPSSICSYSSSKQQPPPPPLSLCEIEENRWQIWVSQLIFSLHLRPAPISLRLLSQEERFPIAFLSQKRGITFLKQERLQLRRFLQLVGLQQLFDIWPRLKWPFSVLNWGETLIVLNFPDELFWQLFFWYFTLFFPPLTSVTTIWQLENLVKMIIWFLNTFHCQLEIKFFFLAFFTYYYQVNGDTLFMTGDFKEFKVESHANTTWDPQNAMASTAVCRPPLLPSFFFWNLSVICLVESGIELIPVYVL